MTAIRRATDLQSTPLSIQAFSSEQLELSGIEPGQYTARGFFDGNNGIGPNTPFAYAPDNSASIAPDVRVAHRERRDMVVRRQLRLARSVHT